MPSSMHRILFTFGFLTILHDTCARTCSSISSYASQKDLEVGLQAKSKALEFCKDGFKGEADPIKGHENLVKGVGGENRVYNILKNANSSDELSEQAQEQLMDVGWLIRKGLPVVMALVTFFIWFVCCWTCWPCCKRCRCCVKERDTYRLVKWTALFVLLGLAIGFSVTAVLARAGASRTLDGLDNFACTSATLVSATLNGTGTVNDTNPYFDGMVPILTGFQKLDTKLNAGSSFMQHLDKTLDQTYSIDVAVTEAMETLKLMKDTLNLDENMYPLGSESMGRMYQCELCTALQEPLGKLIDTLDHSIGKSLADARAEVRTQLDTKTRADLQCNIRQAVGPLADVKDSVRDSLEWFIKEDGLGAIQDKGETPVLLVSAFAIGVCALVLACACSSAACFAMREKRRETGSNNPYNFWVHRAAAASWCCGFAYVFFIFLVGGILIAVSVPVSGLCLVLEDIDSAKVTEIYPALGLDSLKLGTDNYDMAMRIVDQCFSPKHVNQSGNLMDIMFIREEGDKVSMREKLMVEIVDRVEDEFEKLGQANTSALTANPELANLMELLATNPISSFILPQKIMQDDERYRGLAFDDRGARGLAIGFATSLNCQNHTVPAGSDPLPAGTISGIVEFGTRLQRYGSVAQPPAGSCIPQFTCTPGSEKEPCDSATKYLSQIESLTMPSSRIYRCDVFEHPTTKMECDPAALRRSADNSSWENSCAESVCTTGDGCTTTLVRKARLCNLQEFELYVKDYKERIFRTLDRVDKTVPQVNRKIQVDLKEWVDVNVLGLVKQMVDGSSCGFLTFAFQDTVASLCYQSAWGFRAMGNAYAVMGSLTMIVIILTYAIWRRALDNANSWKPPAFASYV
mmetsp:Transcript_88716/g.162613  ORF Transcript_88716/g.162613 Transcript_88716/m.162613 type:complete len:860 (+) Transcript_88716:85-2664(+)